MRNILFVCTGNTCRSPMAEAIFNKLVSENIDAKNFYLAKSVGVAVNLDDKKASPNAIEVIKKLYNIDISSHNPKQLSKDDIQNSDLVLCMDNYKKMYILQLFPANYNKVYSIKEYVGLDGGVSDPYGGNLDVYEKCAKELEYLIELIIKKEEKIRKTGVNTNDSDRS